MSAAERWADRCEWAQERGEIEIKSVGLAEQGDLCSAGKCLNRATRAYEIGIVARRSGTTIPLCADHDSGDFALELYERRRSQ